jgi:Uma2 family endonuclease
MSAARKKPAMMTVAEFLEWPGDGTGRWYDLVDGVPRAHAAPSDLHGRMHATVSFLLTAHIRQHFPGCSVVIGGGVRPKLRANWNYRVPDITITCDKNAKRQHDVPDPVIIVELLSPSNKADTWDNVRNYTTVPSVAEIVIIDTTRVYADVLVRDALGHWPDDALELTAGGIIRFPSINFDLPLDDAYRGTYLEV